MEYYLIGVALIFFAVKPVRNLLFRFFFIDVIFGAKKYEINNTKMKHFQINFYWGFTVLAAYGYVYIVLLGIYSNIMGLDTWDIVFLALIIFLYPLMVRIVVVMNLLMNRIQYKDRE
jgi:biotin transporter BioY